MDFTQMLTRNSRIKQAIHITLNKSEVVLNSFKLATI
jgi:hypothetical protein